MQTKNKWWGLGALALAGLVVGLDLTILNVALPTLATALHASTSDLQWFANAYNLVLAAMLIPAGLLGDRFGRKKLLITGLALFGVASAMGAFATTIGSLITARAILGLAAALVTTLSISVLTTLFTPAERQKAIGVLVITNILGVPLGPLLGGALLDHFWWGSIFLINIPIILVALPAIALLVPESRSEKPPRIDVVGMITSSSSLAALTYGCIRAGEKGWGSSIVVGSLVGGALLLAAFILRERRNERLGSGRSLIDLSLFKSKAFTWGLILAMAMTFALFGLLFVLPQYLQAIVGLSAFDTGLRLLPLVIGLLISSRVGIQMAPKFGINKTVAVGFALVAAALFAANTMSATTGYPFMATWLLAVGLGMGLVMPTAMGAALATLPADRSGVGSAVMHSFRTVGGTIGVAILGTIINSVYRHHVDVSNLPAVAADAVQKSVIAGVQVAHIIGSPALFAQVEAAFIHAADVMFLTTGSIAIVAIVLALIYLPSQTSKLKG